MPEQNREKKQRKIFEKIQALSALIGVNVSEGNQGVGTIHIESRRKHELDIRLTWYGNHYLAYPLAHGDEHEGPAIMSIYSEIEAIEFVSVYLSIHQLRARRKKPT
jgi:hypothetical protein